MDDDDDADAMGYAEARAVSILSSKMSHWVMSTQRYLNKDPFCRTSKPTVRQNNQITAAYARVRIEMHKYIHVATRTDMQVKQIACDLYGIHHIVYCHSTMVAGCGRNRSR
jgi:hypothetical protein